MSAPVLLGLLLAGSPAAAATVERRLADAGISNPSQIDPDYLIELETLSLRSARGVLPEAEATLKARVAAAAKAWKAYQACRKTKCSSETVDAFETVLHSERVLDLRFARGQAKAPSGGCTPSQRDACMLECAAAGGVCPCCQRDAPGAPPRPPPSKRLVELLADSGISQPWALDEGVLERLEHRIGHPKTGYAFEDHAKRPADAFAAYLRCRGAVESGDEGSTASACAESAVSGMRPFIEPGKIAALRRVLGLPYPPRVGCDLWEMFACTMVPNTGDCCRDGARRASAQEGGMDVQAWWRAAIRQRHVEGELSFAVERAAEAHRLSARQQAILADSLGEPLVITSDDGLPHLAVPFNAEEHGQLFRRTFKYAKLASSTTPREAAEEIVRDVMLDRDFVKRSLGKTETPAPAAKPAVKAQPLPAAKAPEDDGEWVEGLLNYLEKTKPKAPAKPLTDEERRRLIQELSETTTTDEAASAARGSGPP